MKKLIIGLFIIVMFIGSTPVSAQVNFIVERTLDLTTREKSPNINQGFADNILLALHYLNGERFLRNKVDWEKIRQPLMVTFTLQPGESFTFHRNASPGLNSSIVSTNSKFVADEGYKSVAGLGGNGVCHLASLINWTAQEAGLEVVSPVNHNFFPIAGIPREFGTSIQSASPSQNLYIRNNQLTPVTFTFMSDSSRVSLAIEKQTSIIIY